MPEAEVWIFTCECLMVSCIFSNSPPRVLVMEACENGFVLVLYICSIDSTIFFIRSFYFGLFEFFFVVESPR